MTGHLTPLDPARYCPMRLLTRAQVNGGQRTVHGARCTDDRSSSPSHRATAGGYRELPTATKRPLAPRRDSAWGARARGRARDVAPETMGRLPGAGAYRQPWHRYIHPALGLRAPRS